MRKILIFIIMAAGAVTLLDAQAGELSFKASGDVTVDAGYNNKNTDSVFNNVPFNSITSSLLLNGKLMFSRQYTTLGLLDFSFEDTDILSHLDGKQLESLVFNVNELYADLNFSDIFFLRLGKQRLKWGVGFSFNPSDPVNPPKDPTDLTRILEGVPAVKAELISRVISLMTFGVLYDQPENTGVGSKLSTSLIPNTDLAVSFYYARTSSWLTALNVSLAPFYDFPGWDSLQIWFEGSIYDKARYASFEEGIPAGSAGMTKKEGLNYNFLVGAQGQIPVIGTQLLAEFYHLSEGLTQANEQAIFTALRSTAPGIFDASASWLTEIAVRPGQLGRNYLFLSLIQPTFTAIGHPFWDYVGFSTSFLMNMTDLSFLLTTTLTTTFVKDSSIELRLNWAYGDKESEFENLITDLTLDLIVKVYF